MNKENKNNLKWALRFLVLAAIISYGLGLTLDRTSTFELISQQTQDDIAEALVVYPEGIRCIVKNYDKKEYWSEVAYIFRIREKVEPTFIGGIIMPFIGEDNGPIKR